MQHEIALKQWHDDDLARFHKEYKLTFGQCDMNNKITLAELLLLTSDAAVEDYNQKGLTWQYLIDNGVSIVTSRLSFKFFKMPVANQKLILNTWEEKPAGLQLTRKYNLCDAETGETLINGFSLWTVIDFGKRKIIPAKMFTLRPEPVLESDYEGTKPGKISIPENLEQIGSHKIVFSDMDANGHTNNSKYANFVIDCLPEEFQNKTFKEMRLNYSKEAVLGEEVSVFAAFNKDENKISVVGKLTTETCFECELFY